MPKHLRAVLPAVAIMLATMPAFTLATSSTNFYEQGGEVFDDWDICRTNAAGSDGFFQVYPEADFHPIILNESLGKNADTAHQIGQQFAKDYPDIKQRAERIFAFARDNVKYITDEDQFSFPEFAQNADELAATIEAEGMAYGDCEDYAVLLAAMYKGAGLRSAIVLAPDHAATLVYLPEHDEANQIMSVDGEPGWVWAEATGGNNPLGWMPERFIGERLRFYEVKDEAITKAEPPDKTPITITKQTGSSGLRISPFFGVIGLMWLLSLFRRRRVAR
ncbi:MAG: transglutaminase domain-containing protein [Dehalococcoidia bacterium]|nr:transglutaminase domain-containing protein [Dehalococcoidia bacterium]